MIHGRAALGLLFAVFIAACSPKLPAGVDKAALDAAVSRAVGDPDTCVLIGARGAGRPAYRYNTHVACGRALPDCAGGSRTVGDLLKEVAADGRPRAASCDTAADGSRSVGWAAGTIAGGDLVYAAMMEGDRSFPGRIMADRLAGAFARAGLSGPVRTAP